MAAEYLNMSLAELKEEAKKRGLKNISTMRKQELIDALSAGEKKSEPEMKAEPVAEKKPQTMPERRPEAATGEMRRPMAPAQGVPMRRPAQGEGTERRVMQPRPGYSAYPQQGRPMGQEARPGYAQDRAVNRKYVQPIYTCDDLSYVVFRAENDSHAEANRGDL